jgi:hypothetical protein
MIDDYRIKGEDVSKETISMKSSNKLRAIVTILCCSDVSGPEKCARE